VRPRNS
jgi:hypothetical protein